VWNHFFESLHGIKKEVIAAKKFTVKAFEGTVIVAVFIMDDKLKLKLEELRDRLKLIEEEYSKAVRSHKTYNTLRSLRDEIKDVKEQLLQFEKTENAGSEDTG